MGNCASPQCTKEGNLTLNWQSTAKIVDVDGRLEEFRQPIKANHILSQNPKCFLCSSESMYVNCHMPHVPDDEELQLGQIYFLMPLSMSHAPLSLSELCALAIKASAALAPSQKTPSYLQGNAAGGSKWVAAGSPRFCKTPFNENARTGHGSRQIEL